MLQRVLVSCVICLLTLSAATADDPAAQDAAFKIVVLAGEDSVNIIQQKTAVAPVVEVRDRNDQPVVGALVQFTVRGGRNARLNQGLRMVQVATDGTGRAAVTGLTPIGNGLVQIDVSATIQGQTITATITQTNVATAAQAAAVGGAGETTGATGGAGGSTTGTAPAGTAGGGGLSGTTIAGLSVAAGAGALVATLVGGGSTPAPNRAPVVTGVLATPALGLQAATPIQFSAQASDADNDSLSYSWDFGDGTTGAGATQTHVYNVSGTFAVRVTLNDGKQGTVAGQAVVTIKSLTGRWTCFTCASPTAVFYQLTQSGSSLTGTYFFPDSPQVVNGRVQTASPQISFGYVCSGQGCPFIFAGGPGADVDSLTGTVTNGTTSQSATSVRLP